MTVGGGAVARERRADGDAEEAARRAAADPRLLDVVAQPIVDLTDGRPAGFELLARVPAGWGVAPDRLFAAARRLGLAAALQATVNRIALGLLERVPVGCFLTVNLDPDDLSAPEVVAPFLDLRSLAPLVVEVTEKAWPDSSGPADDALAALRERGALLAVDDVGAGFAGLTQISRLRPEIVKLDQALVADLGSDPAAELVVAALGRLCGQLDAWVVAEGIEQRDQLDVLVRLGVPLGQGYLLGRGERPWPGVPGAGHVHAAPVARDEDDEVRVGDLAVDLDRDLAGRWERGDAGVYHLVVAGRWFRAMTMAPCTRAADALLRAVARPPEERWLPVLVTDATGEPLGQVGVEAMVTAAVGDRATGRPQSVRPRPAAGPG